MSTSPQHHPPQHVPGPGPVRGIVWSEVLAEMKAEAQAAGDTRFDDLVTERRRTPFEAQPLPVERLTALRARRGAAPGPVQEVGRDQHDPDALGGTEERAA